jgi:hypothetical protein
MSANRMNGTRVRSVVMEVLREQAKSGNEHVSAPAVLRESINRLGASSTGPAPEGVRFSLQQAVLVYWNDLIRAGLVGWGASGGGWDFDACLLTDQGRKAMEQADRDPINPDGYMHHLRQCAALDPVAESYLKEALHTYRSGCFKATAVLLGTAAEGVILALRDSLCSRLSAAKKKLPKGIQDWRIAVVTQSLTEQLDFYRSQMPADLGNAYVTFWLSFTSHVRSIRNSSGHPNSIEPVSDNSVHAALLLFPDFAKLAGGLNAWIGQHTF